MLYAPDGIGRINYIWYMFMQMTLKLVNEVYAILPYSLITYPTLLSVFHKLDQQPDRLG